MSQTVLKQLLKNNKGRLTGGIPNDGNTKDAEIGVSSKYLSNVRKILERKLVNFEINLILTRSVHSVISNSVGAGTFIITDTKL